MSSEPSSIALPLVLILLFLIFRGLVAAAVPLLIGGLAVLGALSAIRLIETATMVSTFAINTISLLGLGMAIDYSLIIITRYREELRAGGAPRDAATATLTTAGRTVVVSGVTVGLSLACLLVFPEPFLKSMAYGGMAAVLVAMICAVTVLPALLVLLGGRINALRLGRRPAAEPRRDGPWARLAWSVMRRPVAAIVVVVVVLGVLASSLAHLRLGGFDVRVLPDNAESRVASERLSAAFPQLADAPIQVLVTGATAAQVVEVEEELRELSSTRGVAPVTGTDAGTLLLVSYEGSSGSADARGLVADIRGLDTAEGVSLHVTGPPAAAKDQIDSLGARLPLMLALMAAATLVLLFLAFGSVLVPVKAVVVNAMSVAATLGVLVWAFQDGHLAGVLGFTSTGDLEPTTLVLVVALLFGLATDYEVFLLSRVREEWDRENDSGGAVARGLQRTGGLITAAALLLGVVTAGFAAGDIVISKVVGVGMVVGLVIDALLVRVILVPAVMRLLGRSSWWLPRPLRSVHHRFGVREGG
jgi:trehalose monomycolate/heme transporter